MNHPLLFEINTRCWLREMSDRLGGRITLATVPEDEFDRWQRLGFTHLWLMGVWTTGDRARDLALNDPSLLRVYDELLPGWRLNDIGGSPYSIAAYEVPAVLGGEEGLRLFRQRLHGCGLKLVLDFVPNHLGFDHPWTSERPDLFVQSRTRTEGTFAVKTPTGRRWLAHGKDPHFEPWTDTVQLDYRGDATQAAMQEVLLSLAARCDGLRCDMAMLMLDDVFERTWAGWPCRGTRAATGFWEKAIPAARARYPTVLFLAEVYWGLETRLQALGFNYTYDKQFHDDLLWGHGTWAQRRLLESPPGFVSASAHFLENHDERRVADALDLARHQAAALVTLGLPGLRLLHEGQLTGAKIKLPVQLSRRPPEEPVVEIQQFYERLLSALREARVGEGHPEILEPLPAWPENPSGQSFILVQWRLAPQEEFALVVVNLAPHRAQCTAPLTVPRLDAHNWLLRDLLSNERHERCGDDLARQGLYLDLPAHGAQLFVIQPIA